MTDEFELTQDFVKPKSDRKQLIREKLQDSVRTSRQIVPGGQVEELALIVLPIQYLIYNADNVRIRDKVLTNYQIENTDATKFDQEFYSKRENFDTQQFIHESLVDLAQTTDADIYSRLEREKSQRDPLLIDTDGVIVDGNRRMATMRSLFIKDETEFNMFSQVECAVIPEASRSLNKEYEHQIHFAASLQLEYTWLNKALEAQRLESEGKNNNEIKRQLQLTSVQEADNLLTKAKGMQQYNRLKEGFDENHSNNNYVDLGQYGNEQSFLEIGKVMNKDIPAKEKTQQTIIQSITHFVVQNDRRAIGGRAFNLNQSNKSHKLFDWYKRSINVDNSDDAYRELKKFAQCKNFEELRDIVQTINSKRLQDENQERENQQQSQSLNRTETALDALESININNATTRRSHLRRINSNLNKIEKEVEELRKKIEEKTDTLD